MSVLNPVLLASLSSSILETTALSFPPPGFGDLEARLGTAAREFGFDDPLDFALWLLSDAPTAEERDRWTNQLTVGETYFWREPEAFEALERQFVPELLRKKSAGKKTLRLWSAGCSTGEEAYSLAIALKRSLPGLDEWEISLAATDLNAKSLAKARAGIYGTWSFRNSPPWLREQYFRPLPDGLWEVRPELKRMVSFRPFNLASAWDTEPGAPVDAVFCRNVLMYFSPAGVDSVLEKMQACLAEGGWFVVSASELSLPGLARFEAGPIATVYRKRLSAPEVAPTPMPEPMPMPEPAEFPSFRQAPPPKGSLWSEVLDVCRQALADDRLNPSVHYLQAVIHQELGHTEQAMEALQRTLYLDPGHARAYFALGGLLRAAGDEQAARRCFRNALEAGPEEAAP